MGTYKNIVDEMFQSVGQSVGIHVMLLVIEHALWKTKQKYDEAILITFSEDGICMEGLSELDPERANLIAHEFIISIIAGLGRLIGKQLASQLTEQLTLDFAKKGE